MILHLVILHSYPVMLYPNDHMVYGLFIPSDPIEMLWFIRHFIAMIFKASVFSASGYGMGHNITTSWVGEQPNKGCFVHVNGERPNFWIIWGVPPFMDYPTQLSCEKVGYILNLYLSLSHLIIAHIRPPPLRLLLFWLIGRE